MYYTYLYNLPYCATKKTKACFFRTTKQGLTILKTERAATAAGFDGAINVWIDDQNRYRGSLMRNCVTIEKVKTNSLKALENKLNQWLPECSIYT